MFVKEKEHGKLVHVSGFHHRSFPLRRTCWCLFGASQVVDPVPLLCAYRPASSVTRACNVLDYPIASTQLLCCVPFLNRHPQAPAAVSYCTGRLFDDLERVDSTVASRFGTWWGPCCRFACERPSLNYETVFMTTWCYSQHFIGHVNLCLCR